MKLKWNGNLRRREAPLDNLQMTIIGDATRSQAQASGAARRSSAVTRGGFAAARDRTRSDVRQRVARIPPGIVTGVRSTRRAQPQPTQGSLHDRLGEREPRTGARILMR